MVAQNILRREINILSRIVHLVGFICRTAAKIFKSSLFCPEDRGRRFREITDNYQTGYKPSLSTTLLSHQHYLKNMAM
jgi:HKD family nuclease